MNAYSEYKDSGIEWIGEIPSHWKAVRLGWLADVQTGSTPSTSIEKYWENPSENWFTPGDFSCFRLDNSKRKVSTHAFEEQACRLFPSSTVLMVGIGATLGRIAYTEGKCSANQQINAILFKEGMFYKYGAYYLSIISDIIKALANAATLPIINQEQTKRVSVLVPPLPEQEAIATYLDEKTAKIDELIAEKTKQVEDLRTYRTSVITETVTHGLNPNVSFRQSGIDWIGEIPSHWKKMRFKNFLTLITNVSTSQKKIGLENIEGTIGRFVATDSEFEGNGVAFERGDIIYGKLRPYLKKVWLADFEGNAVGDFFVFRVNDNALNRYCKWLLLSEGFTQTVSNSTDGAKMPRVSSSFIQNIGFYLPPLSEQESIATYLDEKTAKIDELITELNHQLEELAEYRQAVISEAVTGKVDVRNYKSKL